MKQTGHPNELEHKFIWQVFIFKIATFFFRPFLGYMLKLPQPFLNLDI